MTTQERLDERRAALAEVQREIDFLELLPPDLPVRHAYRLHGQWYLSLTGGALADLLPALPAQPICLRADGWGRLEAHAAQAHEVDLPCCALAYPVWYTRGGLNWFTRIGKENLLVRVTAADASMQDPTGYARQGTTDLYWTRKRVQPLLHDSQGPQVDFDSAWEAFFAVERYTEAQKMFARVFRMQSARNVDLSAMDLPLKPVEVLEVAGEQLQVRRSGPGVPETVPEGSKLFALPRIGLFWNRFTDEQAERLLQFSNAFRRELEAEDAAFIKQTLTQAREAAQRFIREHVQTQRNRPKADVLQYAIQRELGVAVSVSPRESLTRSLGDRVQYAYWMHLRRYNEDLTIELPALYDPQGFDWDFPGIVDYEPLAPATVA